MLDSNNKHITLLDDSTAIINFCKAILPICTHIVTHDTEAAEPTICYTLTYNNTNDISIDSITEAICTFLKFHICQNFIFSDYDTPYTSELALSNRITQLKISLNDIDSITIDPSKVLQILSLPLVTIISPLTHTLKTFISSLLNTRSIAGDIPLNISCKVLLKNQIYTTQLKKVLETNEPLTKTAVSFYHILKIYKELFITNLADRTGHFDLNIFNINTTYQTLTPQVALGIIKSLPSQPTNTPTLIKKHFFRVISETCLLSEAVGIEIYKINPQILSQLPNLTENAFQYQHHYNAAQYTVTYQLLCGDLDNITTCNQLYNYIYFCIILHNSDNIKLSLEFSLKDEFIEDADNYTTHYSYDVDINTSIKVIISSIYFQNKKLTQFRKFLEQNILPPENIAQEVLQKYNISIQAQIINNISQEITTLLSDSAALLETHTTDPIIIEKHTSVSNSSIPLPTEEHVIHDSKSLQDELSIQHTKTSRTTFTEPITHIPQPSYRRKRSKVGYYQKHIHNIISSKTQKNKVFVSCIVTIAIISIVVYYSIAETLLNHIPDITKINLVVIGGIFSFTTIAIIGSTLYNHIGIVRPSTNTENANLSISISTPYIN
ncbi:hypothetical protein [Ehrlichia ruminantium]|uniref:hypothetical protein n=1 Tax=Ehrlichia ruminantium TaxID=779 RepID=UPI0007A0AED9|nr:hypothetical protein [Ehrlichia ruminantium]KYW92286.1 hypothetical protein AUR40_02810 [Ehrlichia ruminantium]